MNTPSHLYLIRIGQHLDPECSEWLAGLSITNLDGGEAILSGLLIDQAALYGVLHYLRDLNVPLISLIRSTTDDVASPFNLPSFDRSTTRQVSDVDHEPL